MLYVIIKSVKHYKRKNKHKQYLSCNLWLLFFLFTHVATKADAKVLHCWLTIIEIWEGLFGFVIIIIYILLFTTDTWQWIPVSLRYSMYMDAQLLPWRELARHVMVYIRFR